MKRNNLLWLVIIALVIVVGVLGWRLTQPPKPKPANVAILMDDAGRLGFSVVKGDTVTISLSEAAADEGAFAFQLLDGPCGTVSKSLTKADPTFTCLTKANGSIRAAVIITPAIAIHDSASLEKVSSYASKATPKSTVLPSAFSVTPCKGCVSGEVLQSRDFFAHGFLPSGTIGISCGANSVASVPDIKIDSVKDPTIHWKSLDGKPFTVVFPAGQNPCTDISGKAQTTFTAGSCYLYNYPSGTVGSFPYTVSACGNVVTVTSPGNLQVR